MIKFIFLILFIPLAEAQVQKEKLTELFKEKTKIENPLDLRDPFRAPYFKSEAEAKKRKGYFSSGKGEYSNIGESQIENLVLHDIKVVGVLIGKERRALVHATPESKKVIILKEGMKIGADKAELKAILPGGIVLVEKIVNVYGQEEFLETVIPISR
ncbi:MAG TPA: hypothetical protein VNJ08_00080 [Bacteriovoracaceae bacterium]|nr:hypothetical protein [Bacteriovoracaceae bacterium]